MTCICRASNWTPIHIPLISVAQIRCADCVNYLIIGDDGRRWISIDVNRVLCDNVCTRINHLMVYDLIKIGCPRATTIATV